VFRVDGRLFGSWLIGGLNERKIANSLTERCGHKTFQISVFWADYGQTAPYRSSSDSDWSGGVSQRIIDEFRMADNTD
jgi:hypothetical protein